MEELGSDGKGGVHVQFALEIVLMDGKIIGVVACVVHCAACMIVILQFLPQNTDTSNFKII